MSLHASGLYFTIDGVPLVRNVSLDIASGAVHAVLGPNGAGKSTLLRLLSGELRANRGGIVCAGRPLSGWTPAQLARLRAVLPQREQLGFGFSVEDVVRLGRLPCPAHSPERELEIILDALDLAGVGHLRARRYPSLSGGERSRVQLARVLAQIWEPVELGPRLLLLDEPTASLDLAHQHHCLRVARAFAERGVAVLAVLHDPNLVMAYADQVTLLCCGEALAQGTPKTVLTAAHLEQMYGVPIELSLTAGQPWVRVATERMSTLAQS